jgi:tetratricopeptide (TPR) repeat protein
MSCPASSTVGSTRLRTMLLVSALFAIVSGIGLAMYLSRDPSDLEDIKLVLRERHFPEAETRARKWLETHPRDAAAMVLLGEALQRQGSLAEAITVYQGIPGIAGAQAMTAQLALASIFLRQGRLEDAESRLLRLKVDEQHQEIADGLRVTLLSLSGRRFESIPYLHKTLETVGDRFMKLIYLAIPDEMPAPPQDVFARMFQVRDPLGALGCARVAASLGRSAQAMSLIQECLVKRPDLIEAHVALGTLLLDAGDLARFDQWLASLPKTADQHPTTWILRGRRVQDSGNRPEAIRCYWEVLRRQPNHDYSTYQLGQLLAAEGRENESSLFLERAKRLTQLIELSVRLYEDRGAENEVGDCARLTYELGRLQECHAWCEHLLSISPDNPAALELLLTLQKELRPDTPWVLPDSDLAARFDLSSYPLPQFPLSPSGTRDSSNSHVEEDSRISFVDDSERVGLQFVYFNGDDPSSKGKRMFEYTGGGVAALDFDRDGWCDVYFTQGTVWPPDPANHQYLDVMFRNQAGETMQDVTAQTGIQDPGFGQGVAAADFNNDGFADLYVANVDGNRLYRNNGDGTFADVTQLSGLGQHPHWTTSCLVADVNGDSLPDVFDVTFLAGDDIFSRICQSDDGVSRSCAPAGFAAAPDHACINLGDGKFRDMTEQLGFDTPNGDGLGIVAADFDDSGTISLFVGNDGRANFFYVPESSASGELVFREIGDLDATRFWNAIPRCRSGRLGGSGRCQRARRRFHSQTDSVQNAAAVLSERTEIPVRRTIWQRGRLVLRSAETRSRPRTPRLESRWPDRRCNLAHRRFGGPADESHPACGSRTVVATCRHHRLA